MPDRWTRDVLLVLCEADLPHGEARAEAMSDLDEVMSVMRCPELHVLEMREFKTDSFSWPLLLEFRVPAQCEGAQLDAWADSVQRHIIAVCRWVEPRGIRPLRYRQTGFGAEHDGADVIVSFYAWQTATAPADRKQAMSVHFDMERQEKDYTAVHFNVACGPDDARDPGFDFAFESYVDDPAGLARIYSNPRLEMMRDHSRTFLDTNTRRLAFGKVRIRTLR